MIAFLVLLALALLIFAVIGTIKIAAWLLIFIVLGVAIAAIIGAIRLRRGSRA